MYILTDIQTHMDTLTCRNPLNRNLKSYIKILSLGFLINMKKIMATFNTRSEPQNKRFEKHRTPVRLIFDDYVHTSFKKLEIL